MNKRLWCQPEGLGLIHAGGVGFKPDYPDRSASSIVEIPSLAPSGCTAFTQPEGRLDRAITALATGLGGRLWWLAQLG